MSGEMGFVRLLRETYGPGLRPTYSALPAGLRARYEEPRCAVLTIFWEAVIDLANSSVSPAPGFERVVELCRQAGLDVRPSDTSDRRTPAQVMDEAERYVLEHPGATRVELSQHLLISLQRTYAAVSRLAGKRRIEVRKARKRSFGGPVPELLYHPSYFAEGAAT